MNNRYKALIALLATVLLWSVHAIVSRTTVLMVPPMILSFFRMLVAAILFFPFLMKYKPWRKNKFSNLLLVSLLSSSNVLFFIWGIQYTTASASQLIYAAIPVLMVFMNIFIAKDKISTGRILGVMLGLVGIMYIIYLSAIEKGTTITGNLTGNVTVFIAMLSWLIYIYFSKKLTKYFSPLEIGSVSVFVTVIINFFLAVIEYFITGNLGIWSINVLVSGLYMGIGGTFLAYICYQYAIKNVSTITVSLSSYIQPITTAILASILIGEKLTANFLLGSILVFSGIFLTTTLEIYKRRK